MVEEEPETHHQKERPAEGCDGQMRLGHDGGVGLGVGRGEDQRLARSDPGGDDHDQQGKDDPHAKNRNQDPPGQEASLPDGRHVL